MDRSAFAACAVAMSLVVVGCDRPPTPPPHDHAPLVLAELKAASPGPWRRDGGVPLAPTSLERLDPSILTPPKPLPPADASASEPGGSEIRRQSGQPELRFVAPVEVDPGLPATPIDPAAPHDSRASRPTETSAVPRRLHDVAAHRPVVAPQPVPVDPELSEHVTLPWANAPQGSVEMSTALRQADEHVRHGISLTERNATHLARAEFLAALQLIAQASDAHQNNPFFTDALTAGLVALDESEDFVRPHRVGKRVDVARVVRGHKTPVLKNVALDRLSPAAAAERYHTYAQEQLAAAAAREACGSRALFGLGKLAIALGQGSPAEERQGTFQAGVFYQAALLADANNGRAANELGVIVARNGDLPRARDLLAHGARLSPHPSTHHNLATVYAKLGETMLAEQAKSQALALEQAGHRRAGPAVQWLDPATFSATAPASDSLLPPVAKAAPAPQSPTADANLSTARKGFADWLPWNPRR